MVRKDLHHQRKVCTAHNLAMITTMARKHFTNLQGGGKFGRSRTHVYVCVCVCFDIHREKN